MWLLITPFFTFSQIKIKNGKHFLRRQIYILINIFIYYIIFKGGTQLKTLAGKSEEVTTAAPVTTATAVRNSGDASTSMSDDEGGYILLF